MLKNVQEAKFRAILTPIAKVALGAADHKDLDFEAFFTFVLMHETHAPRKRVAAAASDARIDERVQHPPLAEAIEQERSVLAGVADLGHRIDTTGLQPKALRGWIRDLLGLGGGELLLLFESFAYKHGIPLDADWVIDSRMLPNPHYEPALRALTGRDAPVIEFLEAQEPVQRLIDDVRGLLGRWLPEVVRDNRSYLTVAIGCTGGRHRSVYLAERLAQSFAPDWRVLVRHRGLAGDGP